MTPSASARCRAAALPSRACARHHLAGAKALAAGSLRALALIALVALPLPALAQLAPDALVKQVSEEVLQIVRTDPKVQAGDRARIREVLDTKLAPHFDFERMTALAVGRGWREASPAQKKALIEQFRTLLERTYSNAFVQYRDETIRYRPLRMPAGATDATVHTEIVRQGGGQPVQIDYSLGLENGQWKAYDVIVGGVSLVTTYRDEFAREIQAGGIDGLIRSLEAKNAAPPPPPPVK
jgi:phospholipid transport system substrate-binding protein